MIIDFVHFVALFSNHPLPNYLMYYKNLRHSIFNINVVIIDCRFICYIIKICEAWYLIRIAISFHLSFIPIWKYQNFCNLLYINKILMFIVINVMASSFYKCKSGTFHAYCIRDIYTLYIPLSLLTFGERKLITPSSVYSYNNNPNCFSLPN